MQRKLDKIMAICEKRGFFFPSAEIYGGKAGFWTYGHLGTLLKRKFENEWRNFFLNLDENFYEIEDCNLLPEQVFVSSGHLEHFRDPLTECKKCHFRFRADELIEDELNINVEGIKAEAMDKIIRDNNLKCPKCGSRELTKVRWFNMMFELKVGAVGEETMYLRPETAQSAYLSFKREFYALREKLPIGLAIIGKAYRNEISPRQVFFRLREFTQAELQIFFDPKKINEVENWNKVRRYKLRMFLAKNRKSKKVVEMSCEDVVKKLNLPKMYVYYLAMVQRFYLNILKIPKEKFRLKELTEKERAFYNKIHYDVELFLETLEGFKEVAGIHYRTDYDLRNHQEGSKESMEVINEKKEKFIPHVLELSFGVDRNVFSIIDIFFKEEKERNLFVFPRKLAPIEVAIFPLVRKDKLPQKARKVFSLLKDSGFIVFYDEKGSIGRMYRRMDEIGCPAMITIDYDSLKNDDCTLRDRDTMKQIRVKIDELPQTILKFLNGEKLTKLGKIFK